MENSSPHRQAPCQGGLPRSRAQLQCAVCVRRKSSRWCASRAGHTPGRPGRTAQDEPGRTGRGPQVRTWDRWAGQPELTPANSQEPWPSEPPTLPVRRSTRERLARAWRAACAPCVAPSVTHVCPALVLTVHRSLRDSGPLRLRAFHPGTRRHLHYIPEKRERVTEWGDKDWGDSKREFPMAHGVGPHKGKSPLPHALWAS